MSIKIRTFDKSGKQLPDFKFPEDLQGWTSGDVSVGTWDTFYTAEEVKLHYEKRASKGDIVPEERRTLKVGDWKSSPFITNDMTFEVVE